MMISLNVNDLVYSACVDLQGNFTLWDVRALSYIFKAHSFFTKRNLEAIFLWSTKLSPSSFLSSSSRVNVPFLSATVSQMVWITFFKMKTAGIRMVYHFCHTKGRAWWLYTKHVMLLCTWAQLSLHNNLSCHNMHQLNIFRTVMPAAEEGHFAFFFRDKKHNFHEKQISWDMRICFVHNFKMVP